jgi:hypothetical protein
MNSFQSKNSVDETHNIDLKQLKKNNLQNIMRQIYR